MNIPFGYLLTLLCALGGFVIHGGDPMLLWQPSEMLILCGAALGTLFASNNVIVLKKVARAIPLAFKAVSAKKRRAIDLLCLLYDLTYKIRKDGLLMIESDIEDPKRSRLFGKYPSIQNDPRLVSFITDYLRMMMGGSLNALQLETVIERELEVHQHEERIPVMVIHRIADALPAFGIVAAVMGVVQTMASIGLPPSELGRLIGAALVGTFLGILLSYAFVAPLASMLEQRAEMEAKLFETVKVVLLAHVHNFPPAMAIEFGRKILFDVQRPSFAELDQEVRTRRG